MEWINQVSIISGRKRAGRIIVLVTEGKEEDTYNKSMYAKNTINKVGQRKTFYRKSPWIYSIDFGQEIAVEFPHKHRPLNPNCLNRPFRTRKSWRISLHPATGWCLNRWRQNATKCQWSSDNFSARSPTRKRRSGRIRIGGFQDS